MKLVFTKEETKGIISEHIQAKLGIDITYKEIKLDFSSYDNKKLLHDRRYR